MELHRVRKVSPIDDYRLKIVFDDDHEFEFNMDPVINNGGIFAALKDREAFKKVFVDPISGNISWPNGADLDTQVLYYEDMTGQKIEVQSARHA